ncbi:hypothetical protein BH09PAT1_BH09PAT1_5040 [soil metagenome]
MRVFKYFIFIFLGITFLISVTVGLFAYFRPQSMIELLTSLTPTVTPSPMKIKGIGVIGDSLSDEYRADDNRGQTYASTTLNWVEVLDRTRNLNFGKWQYWEEPRREGYAYNFARSGATVAGSISEGQHTGLAAEIKKGNVNAVIIFLGANDFFPYVPNGYDAIYNGSLSDAAILQKINRMIADETTIVETLQKAGSVRILLVKVPDWSNHIGAIIAFPDPTGRQKVTDVVKTVNDKFQELADSHHIATADPNEFYDQMKRRENDGKLVVAGVTMNPVIPSDDPHSIFLDDFVHPGTIYNGLFANYLISRLNSGLGTTIKPLSDQEIVSTAGL